MTSAVGTTIFILLSILYCRLYDIAKIVCDHILLVLLIQVLSHHGSTARPLLLYFSFHGQKQIVCIPNHKLHHALHSKNLVLQHLLVKTHVYAFQNYKEIDCNYKGCEYEPCSLDKIVRIANMFFRVCWIISVLLIYIILHVTQFFFLFLVRINLKTIANIVIQEVSSKQEMAIVIL